MGRLIAALIRHGGYHQLADTPSAHQPYRPSIGSETKVTWPLKFPGSIGKGALHMENATARVQTRTAPAIHSLDTAGGKAGWLSVTGL